MRGMSLFNCITADPTLPDHVHEVGILGKNARQRIHVVSIPVVHETLNYCDYRCFVALFFCHDWPRVCENIELFIPRTSRPRLNIIIRPSRTITDMDVLRFCIGPLLPFWIAKESAA